MQFFIYKHFIIFNMKRYSATLLVIAFAALFTQQASARISVNVSYNFREYLDLQAVATAFSRSDDIREFEYRLNDTRNPISNLDLNNDGYIDYLSVEQYSERYEHVIQVNAVLGRNYLQNVATIYVGRDRYNDEYIQIVGNEVIYGYNYIIEPVFRRRPVIVRWLWNWNSPRYVSPYYWGYYPTHYRVKHIIALPAYHNHVKRYVDHRHKYHRIESDSRQARANRVQVDRNKNNERYNDAERRQHTPGRSGADNRIQRNDDNRNTEIRSIENRKMESRQQNVRHQASPEKQSPATKVERSEKKSGRETVREAKPTPQRATPAAMSESKSSQGRSSGKSENSQSNSRR